ncbi:MAG TPA: hypothetical protein VFM11_08180 [Burkholderiales bacterium]|nr:hypothetical protein [Burkholderiales bacterium]
MGAFISATNRSRTAITRQIRDAYIEANESNLFSCRPAATFLPPQSLLRTAAPEVGIKMRVDAGHSRQPLPAQYAFRASAAAALRTPVHPACQHTGDTTDDRNDQVQHKSDQADECDYRNDKQNGCDDDFKNKYAGKFHDASPIRALPTIHHPVSRIGASR